MSQSPCCNGDCPLWEGKKKIVPKISWECPVLHPFSVHLCEESVSLLSPPKRLLKITVRSLLTFSSKPYLENNYLPQRNIRLGA